MMSSQASSTEEPDDGLGAVLPGSYRPEPTRPGAEQEHSVDQVAIRKLGGFNFISPLQWTELDRDQRMRMIKSKSVVFLSQGSEVPLRPALEYLKGLTDRREPVQEPAAWPPPDSRPPSIVDEPLDPNIRPRSRSDYYRED